MRLREPVIFATYASVIVLSFILVPALMNPHSPLSLSGPFIFYILPTFLAVFMTSLGYFRKHSLDRPSRGAALGAWSALSAVSLHILFLIGVLLFAYTHSNGQSGTSPLLIEIGSVGLIGLLVFSPGILLMGTYAGMLYVWVRRRLGFSGPAEPTTPMSRRSRVAFKLGLCLLPIFFLPTLLFLSAGSGLSQLMFHLFTQN